MRCGLGHHQTLADPQIIDLGKQVVNHAGVLTHRTLRLTSRTRREIDVGKLIRSNLDAKIAVAMILLEGSIDKKRLGIRQRCEGLVQGGGAAGFGQHQTAAGAGKHRHNAIGREMRLDRQIHTTGLEHREHGSQPIQIPLRHHTNDTLAAQPARQQSPG